MEAKADASSGTTWASWLACEFQERCSGADLLGKELYLVRSTPYEIRSTRMLELLGPWGNEAPRKKLSQDMGMGMGMGMGTGTGRPKHQEPRSPVQDSVTPMLLILVEVGWSNR